MSDDEIIKSAKGWIELDYHEPTKNAVKELLNAGNVAELRKILGERLAFGTAGLRGPMGAGYNRMNHVTVLQVFQPVRSTASCGADIPPLSISVKKWLPPI